MCKTISSDVIIGNYLIEAIKKSKNEILIDDLVAFDEKINSYLKSDYCTLFSLDKLNTFEDKYPFFIELSDDGKIIFNDDPHTQNSELTTRLNRYFRIGLPSDVVTAIEKASNVVMV